MRQEVEWWLAAARRDLASADGLKRLGIFEGTAFHCEEAAGKMLKGLIVSRGAIWQRTHSCVALLDGLASLGLVAPDTVRTAARKLDVHYIDARYPQRSGWTSRAVLRPGHR